MSEKSKHSYIPGRTNTDTWCREKGLRFDVNLVVQGHTSIGPLSPYYHKLACRFRSYLLPGRSSGSIAPQKTVLIGSRQPSPLSLSLPWGLDMLVSASSGCDGRRHHFHSPRYSLVVTAMGLDVRQGTALAGTSLGRPPTRWLQPSRED